MEGDKKGRQYGGQKGEETGALRIKLSNKKGGQVYAIKIFFLTKCKTKLTQKNNFERKN